MNLGPFFFAAPWALAALAALPLLFLILRATPPAPVVKMFPPLRLLFGIRTEEEQKKRAPWWLVLIRALAAAAMIIGFARPSFAPEMQNSAGNAGPVLIVVDDGWTSAPFWNDAKAAAQTIAADSERAGSPVYLLFTAPQKLPRDTGEQLTGADARARLARLTPAPWRPDRADALKRLNQAPPTFDRVVWISDGLNDPEAENFGKALAARGPLAVRYPAETARAVIAAAATVEGVEATVRRGDTGAISGALAAETLEGASLGAERFSFTPGVDDATAVISLPPEVAARVARVRIVGEDSAGAMRLMPAGSGRPMVGLIDPGAQTGQALLSDLFYVDRAIQPFATARRGGVEILLQQGAQALILPDASRIAPKEAEALSRWIENGGLLIRFAGPRLANAQDEFLPVKLRPGARALGGALAWEQPQILAAFPEDSPFAGLTPAPDAAVKKQVLADPAAERETRVWARLADGAPVVTAQSRGKGLIVLFHITAGPLWSDLPLSGLFVDMLRRTLSFAGRAQNAAEEREADEPWLAERLIDGFGAMAPPGPQAPVIAPEAMGAIAPGPDYPPGLYVRAGAGAAAIDAASGDERLAALPLPNGAQRISLEGAQTLDLAGPLLALAAAAIALDLLLALLLAGRLPRLPMRTATSALAIVILLAAGAPHVSAQAPVRPGATTNDPTLTMRLAYIRTGDPRVDRMSEAGLQALADTLSFRTAVEPGPVAALDPARDDLSAYPVIYWPAPLEPTRLPDAAIAKLDAYMRLGGLLFLDTRDAGSSAPTGPGPAQIMLQGFDVPPLEQIGQGHVLTKAFYLMQSFPGSRRGARVWAETASSAEARDGVPSLMVGDGDWASAWATQSGGRQQEMALRFGVNLVMVALTGNYKADQVHVPALLERLGTPGSDDRRPR
jgi:hypothetical protein